MNAVGMKSCGNLKWMYGNSKERSDLQKFLTERLRANDDENDEIIRFLLLMANWDAVSATLLQTGDGRPLRYT